MTDGLKRRDFFVALGAAFLSVGQTPSLRSGQAVQQSDSAGRVYDPRRAGRPIAPITAGDNDADIQAIEKKLKCSCGCGLDIYTCRTTDFSCTYSPALHKEVLRLAAQGKTAQQILDEFTAQYGEAVLMSPPKRGFNLAGYLVPSIAILIAGVFLMLVLRRWTRETQVATAAGTPVPPDASPAELERLRRELDRLSS